MDLWRIDKPSVLSGPNPTIWQLKGLYRLGFKTIICLIDEMDHAPCHNVEAVKAMRFEYFPIFISDFSAPSVEDFEVVLPTVDWALGQGKVFIHCLEGLKGTGIMGAAYWVYKDSSVRAGVHTIPQSNQGVREAIQPEEGLYTLKALTESSDSRGESLSNYPK